MAKVTLILGPARSGKTKRIVDLVAQKIRKGDPFLLILPSGEALRVFRSRLAEENLQGFPTGSILTFEQLAETILDTAGLTVRIISPLAKKLLIKSILVDMERQGKLKFFARTIEAEGLLDVLSQFIAELKQGEIMPDMLEEALTKKGLDDKDREICQIYKTYQEKLRNLGLYDREGRLWEANARLEEVSDKLFGDLKLLAVDGFYTYSPTELKILSKIAKLADETVLTLSFDRHREELFPPVIKTFYKIKKHFSKEGLPIKEEMIELHRVPTTALEFVQDNIFSPSGVWERRDGTITIIEAPGRIREIEKLAKLIKSLIVDENYAPGDIGVIVRDLDGQRGLFERIFKRFGIPVVIREGVPLSSSGAVRTVLKMLDIIKRGWRRDDMLAFLNSSFVSTKLIDVSKFAHITRRANFYKGKDALKRRIEEFIQGSEQFIIHLEDADGKEYLEELKDCESMIGNLQSLITLIETLENCDTMGEFIDALVKLIKKFGIYDSVLAGEKAEFHARALFEFIKALRALHAEIAMLGIPDEMDFESFYNLTNLVAETCQIAEGEPPAGVQILDIFSARYNSFRVVFLCNLVEGEFPKRRRESLIYDDESRRKINEKLAELYGAGYMLEESLHRQDEEMLLFYIAITRAREKLYLLYSTTDSAGKAQLPSYYLDEVRAKIAGDAVGKISLPSHLLVSALDDCWCEEDFARRLVYDIWHEEEVDLACYNFMRNIPLFRHGVEGAFIENMWRKGEGRYNGVVEDWDVKEFLSNRFGGMYTFSASRLDEYQDCPFSFMCKNVLGLEDLAQQEMGIDRQALGILYHRVLYEFYSRWAGSEVDAEILLEEVAKGLFAQFKLIAGEGEFAARKEVLMELLRRVVLCDMEEKGFIPKCFEYSFGLGENGIDPLTVEWGEESVKISGKIDRVDFGVDGEIIRVVDYKGSKSIGKRVEESFQLPVYALAAERIFGGHVSSFRYYAIEQESEKFWKDYDSNKIRERINEFRERVVQVVGGIREGYFPPSPADKDRCSRCTFKYICRYRRAGKVDENA